MYAWFYLLGAIVFEVIGTLALKYSSINNSPIYGIITFIGYLISFTLLWHAIKKIDIGMAYAIWAGTGTALIAVMGIYLFNEQMNLLKALFIGMIIVGAMGLKYFSPSH